MGKSTDNGITFFINRQMLDTEGKRSIHGNIVINGDHRKFSTGLRISEKIWDAKCKQAKGRSPEAQRINISLIKIRKIIENLKTDLLLKDGFISAITVRDAFTCVVGSHFCNLHLNLSPAFVSLNLLSTSTS